MVLSISSRRPQSSHLALGPPSGSESTCHLCYHVHVMTHAPLEGVLGVTAPAPVAWLKQFQGASEDWLRCADLW